MRYQIVLMLGLVVALGNMMIAQQYIPELQAKPDNTKFCADFTNDDGTTGTSCEYKSQGECKKGSIAAGDEFAGCHKRD